MRRECFGQVGMFDTRYLIANDYDMYLRVAASYRLVFVDAPLFKYYVHEGGMSRDAESTILELIAILKSYLSREEKDMRPEEVRERIARFYYDLASRAIDENRWRKASGYALAALRQDALIGKKVPWGRFSNACYRTARPYLAVGYCGLAAMAEALIGTVPRCQSR